MNETVSKERRPLVFLISDTHFGQANILNFKRGDGSPLREFGSIEEMDEHLIERWNSVVQPQDKVYHLGDVGFKNFSLLKKTINRLNGKKILIKGNHDNFKMSQYAQMFSDIRAYHVLDKFLLSHIPVHPLSVSRWKANIHGHLHDLTLEDDKYFNVSVERVNYTPICFDEVQERYI